MAYDITLVRGDGVGPELAEAARRCVDATGVKVNWDVQEEIGRASCRERV